MVDICVCPSAHPFFTIIIKNMGVRYEKNFMTAPALLIGLSVVACKNDTIPEAPKAQTGAVLTDEK